MSNLKNVRAEEIRGLLLSHWEPIFDGFRFLKKTGEVIPVFFKLERVSIGVGWMYWFTFPDETYGAGDLQVHSSKGMNVNFRLIMEADT